MCEIFGEYTESGDSKEFLIISFSPSNIPFQERWRNNGISADFLADYWGTFFPVHDSSSGHSEVKDAVSYIANELLENAVKFSYEASEYPMSIRLYLSDDKLYFYVTNSVNPQGIKSFQSLIRELLTEDTDELYIRKIESNADDDTDSGLGFLTIINDYEASLAWKFENVQGEPDVMAVTTMVGLPIVRR